MERVWREPFTLIAAVILLLAALEFFSLGVLRHSEYAFNDTLLRQLAEQRQPAGDIVLVDIDEPSLERMAKEHGRYPWARSVHAEMVEWIARQKPKAILFDIIFSDRDPLRPDDDAYLAQVAIATPNLFFPYVTLKTDRHGVGLPLEVFGDKLGFSRTDAANKLSRAPLLLPYMAMNVQGRLGAIDYQEDSDGVGRHYPLYMEIGGWHLPSMAAKVVAALGEPLPETQSIRLNWQGPALSYPRISYADIYDDLSLTNSQRPGDEFQNKIVLIGSTATGQHDLRHTPMASIQPAVEIIATALDNLQQQNWLQDAPRWLAPVVTLALILPLWWAFLRRINMVWLTLVLLGLTLSLLFASWLALQQRLWLPLLSPLVFTWGYFSLSGLYSYARAQRERQRSVEIFSRFLDPRVVDELVRNGESALSLKSESRNITVLFSDIRGFTSISERHSAEDVVELLNNYFSRQVKQIFRHGGTMDKFIGDAIMAFWGSPVADALQAEHAVAAALDMADELQRFRRELGEVGSEFDVGIGIHSGPGVVGFIGAENRLEYTAIGDTVNLASRIEGQTKGVARILVSEETRRQCRGAFDFIDHGFYKVKGAAPRCGYSNPEERAPCNATIYDRHSAAVPFCLCQSGGTAGCCSARYHLA